MITVQPQIYPNTTNIVLYNRKYPMPYRKNSIDIVDIKARGAFPANVLSNFSKTDFQLDGVQINSIEGFLQSLKVKDIDEQKRICSLNGFDAKKASKSIKRAKEDILLFWKGKSFRRDSDDFKNLLSNVINRKEKTPSATNFRYSGNDIASVNSFLLALKVKDPMEQKKVFSVSQENLKEVAKTIKPVYDTRTLYWMGKSFSRDSQEYKDLLTRVYTARYNQDAQFRRALRMTKNSILRHSIGKADIADTILTEKEFIRILKNLQKHDSFVLKSKDFIFANVDKISPFIKKLMHK